MNNRKPEQNPQDDISIFQKVENAQWMARFPATLTLLFIRGNFGHRFLSPQALLFPPLVLLFMASQSLPSSRPGDVVLFAYIAIALGLVQKAIAWEGFKRGRMQHSWSPGYSIFSFRFLPNIMRRSRRIERFVDSAVTVVIGYHLIPVSPLLGLTILFSGASIAAFEGILHKYTVQNEMDMVDSLIVAKQNSEVIDAYAPSDTNRQGTTKGSPIPAGLGPDTKNLLSQQKRQQKQKRK